MMKMLASWLQPRAKIQVARGMEVYKLPRTSLIWILASLTLVVLPHVPRMPFWLTLLCLACIGSSVLIFQGRMSYPGSRIKTLVVFMVLVAIIAQYGREIFSTEAIVGVLVVGIALKLLEMKKKRDVLLVIYLCYFTVVAEFIYSQSIPIAVYMGICTWVITSALMSLTQTEEFQRPMRTLKLSGQVLLQSIPLMAALFVLFPRISPLWSVPLQSRSGVTGLSDEMSPGDIGNLTRSGETAFRVEFNSEIPPYQELYWRGITLERFDGREWSRDRNSYPQLLRPGLRANDMQPWFRDIEYIGKPVSYSVILEPTQQNWVFTLMVPQIADERMMMRREFQVNTRRPVSQRLTYNALSYLDHAVDRNLSSPMSRQVIVRNTLLPDRGNERSRAFATQLFEESGSDVQTYIDAVLSYFREQEFFYKLSPSPLGDDPVDDFLFSTREGFCEHYASAFTFLMRAAGIPARVVTGYQGGEFNKYNGTIIVRQYDAHAWSEVWLEDKGWTRVDPTAAIAPGRIEYGSQFTFQEDENFLEDEVFSMLKFRSSSLLINDLMLRLEMIDYAWNRFVLNYDQGMQFSLFSKIFNRVSMKKILITMVGMIFLFIGLGAFLILRKPVKKAQYPANALYLKFCRFLADNGFARRPGESPLHYRDRVCALQPQWGTDVAGITEIYMDLAFRENDEETMREQLQKLKQAVGKFKIIN